MAASGLFIALLWLLASATAYGSSDSRTYGYNATLSTARYDRILKALYLRLRAAGKKPFGAMIT